MSNIEEKIKKLHAMMVDSGASPNERVVAQKLIAKLCEEHFLSLDTVLKNGRDHTIIKQISFTRWHDHNKAYSTIGWAIGHGLGDVIAVAGERDDLHCMIWYGQKSSIEEADFMFTYLIRSISRIRKFPGLKSSAQSLEDGFAYAILQRMQEIVDNTRKHFKESNSTALTVIDNNREGIMKFIRTVNPEITSTTTTSVNKWNVGYEMGRKIGLNKGVTGGIRKQISG